MSWRHFFFSKTIQIGKASVEEITVTVPSVVDPETVRQEEASVTVPEEQEVKTTILSKGQTLRVLALDLFGNKEFWVYIYLENKDKIPNPNRVPSGLELSLPDRATYSINAEDAQSVAKAKSLGNKVLAKF